MALKFSLILSVFLFCGFLAVIPSVSSLQCYREVIEDGNVLNDDGTVTCDGVVYDKCGRLAYTTRTADNNTIDVSIRNCSRSNLDCTSRTVRRRLRKFLREVGDTLVSSSFDLSCCATDSCNAPDQSKDMAKRGKKNKEVKMSKKEMAKRIF